MYDDPSCIIEEEDAELSSCCSYVDSSPDKTECQDLYCSSCSRVMTLISYDMAILAPEGLSGAKITNRSR